MRIGAPDAIELPPGPAWCRVWTAAVDASLQGWFADVGATRSVAVVALGSYARRELCRSSDIDLLLLHDGWDPPDLERLVRALCYPLWDAGLSVGHAVRTVREAIRAAGDRIDTATALTDRRLVAGDQGLLDDLGSRTTRWLRRNGGAVLDQLATADGDRHARAGAWPGMLEPDLKEGAGGLRDLHSLRWAAACVLGEVGLDPLVGARYLGALDRRDLAAAGTTLLAARCALHLVLGSRASAGVDRLRLDLQDEVAARLGMDGDDLLRQVGLAARTVAHVHGRTWPLLHADARAGRRRGREAPRVLGDGIVLVDGLVEIDQPPAGGPAPTGQAPPLPDPSLALRAVAAAAHRGAHLGRRTAESLRRAVAPPGPGEVVALAWDERARGALLEVLRAGPAGLPAASDADHLGLLAAYLPEWPRVRGRPQRNPLHRYDLDTHGWQAVAELAGVVRGDLQARHRQVYAGMAQPDRLHLATFLHDVGKAWPGDHSVVGAEVAVRWLRHMGFDRDTGDHVGRLVRHHLLLPDVATRRDIDDDAELAAVAATVRDVETLDGLYLLSIADGRATGPSSWSAWKEGLIAELHARVRRVLADQEPVAAAETLPDLAALLGRVADRYRLAATDEQVREHAHLLLPLPHPGELRARARPGPAAGTVTVSVVAADRLGLMADCAGVFAGHGLTVLDARLFTGHTPLRSHGIALDWFVVAAPAAMVWDEVVADLRRAAAGTLDVGDLVGRRERRRDARPPVLVAPVPVRVRLHDAPAGARVEVEGPDAPGVLYRLASALAGAGVDVVGARVATLGPAVRDVFFLAEAPPDPHGLVDRLESAARGMPA
jgi:[protein-PII] uridylyltransferase